MKHLAVSLLVLALGFACPSTNASSRINPHDSIDECMENFLNSVLSEDYSALNEYASTSVRNKILHNDINNVILEKVIELEALDGAVTYASMDNPKRATFILRYRIEGDSTDRYGVLYWIYFEEGWRFVTLPFSIYRHFPFVYKAHS